MGTERLISKIFDVQDANVSKVGVAKKARTDAKEAFFSYLNQGTMNGDPMAFADSKSPSSSAYEGSKESYDRYQYKSSNIHANDNAKAMKVEISEKDIDSFEKDIIETVCEQLDVTEEEVVDAMQMLGLTVFDLLNPQMLAEITVELSDVQDASALLLDARFQSLLADVADCGNDFMGKMQLDIDQMKMLVSQMEVMEQPEVVDSVESINLEMIEGMSDLEQSETVVENVSVSLVEAGEIVIDTDKSTVENAKTMVQDENIVDVEPQQKVDATIGQQPVLSEQKEGLGQSKQEEHELLQESSFASEENGSIVEEKADLGTKKSDRDHIHIQVESPSVTENQNVTLNDIPVGESTDTYVSVDTVRIIEQIVERVRVNHLVDASTIEMQLNPENLGKMYLNISSKQGVVNAQIAATNESVKEALEAQIVELRESLNQAGVKVDAIEVTIASHEFERNLEQGQSREEQEAERQEELKSQNRRNIDASSLEEMAGVMSEEEALVAQIMKDNGNSVDFMA